MSGELLSVEAAQATVLAGVEPLAGAEWLAPEDALGRVLAAPLDAAVSLPPWDNSAMDGYAIRAADVADAADSRPVRLTVVGEVRAGLGARAPGDAGTAVRIATGAPVPPGADAVVPVELTTPLDAVGHPGPARPRRDRPAARGLSRPRGRRAGHAIRERGSDVHEGDLIAAAGDLVDPGGRGAGRGRRRSPRVGPPPAARRGPRDRRRGPGARTRPSGPAGIPDANGPGLRALVRDAGAVPLDLGIAEDRLEDVETRLRRGLAEARSS